MSKTLVSHALEFRSPQVFNHHNEAERAAFGQYAETLFKKTWLCHCFGEFAFIGGSKFSKADYECVMCGQLVEVKRATNPTVVNISSIPFDHYPDEIIIAILFGTEWRGIKKCHILKQNLVPLQSAHANGKQYSGTTYYRFLANQFVDLSFFGLIPK